ncbi:MAG: electron transfer flavoprotein subunit beta/FixA family protein, partial [Planctomycetota bacterium]
MSNYIVLVKQVPDITQITDNAFDMDTGNLIRSRLASVINDLDAQALAFANQMRCDSNDKDAQLICLTMGPPMAEEVLRYSLSRCADKVVLLTDRALGGADTWATANPLAFAIRKIIKEMFNNSEDYYIVSGMQSVDGDTAQVPPQIAEELKLPCIAYVTDAEFKSDHFEFTRIISGGSQTVTAKKLPAVITIAKYEYPLFATFAATRKANQVKIITWGAEDVKPTGMGVQGSKTRVIKVFPPGKSVRKCRQVSDVKELAELIADSLKAANGKEGQSGDKKTKTYKLPDKRETKFDRSFEGTEKEIKDYKLLIDKLNELGIKDASEIDEEAKEKILAVAGKRFHKKALEDMIEGLILTEPTYSGEVWVQAEHNQDLINSATLELIGKAKDLADCLDTKAGVLLAGYNVEPMAKKLIAAGADKVYLIEHELLSEFDPTAYKKAVADCIIKYWPQIVLYGATPQGRMLAPMISYRVGCG